jgi:threonine dehydratase
LISASDLRLAQERIAGHVLRTPLIPCPGGDLLLKPENLQATGAFKLRGAFNKISSLSRDERARGVVAHSSGNHAQAVAYAATALGVRAVIVMPRNAPQNKLRATKSHGAEVVIVGDDSSERVRKAEELAADQDLVPVPPYDDDTLIAGQGTVGMEIVEDLPDVELVLVPVSGGGLISGVATAIKKHRPEARVIGVEPALAADAKASLQSGEIVEISASDASRTIADGLRVRRLGEAPWEHVREYVDDIVTVSEEEILDSVRRLALRARLVAEPSGAVAFAAYLFHQDELPPTRNNVAVISGGNVEPDLLARVLEK